MACSNAKSTSCVANGCVKTPAGTAWPLWLEVWDLILEASGCGALSLPLQDHDMLINEIRGNGMRSTYKKNLGSPLHAALIRASRSDGFLGIGLQKARGSTSLSLPVR